MTNLDLGALLTSDPAGWETRLAYILETMREMSRHTDPQEMVRYYATRMAAAFPRKRSISISRRGHEPPEFRITRDADNDVDWDPWMEQHRHPRFAGGLLAELIYSDEPRIIDELKNVADDPAAAHLEGTRSLMAIPLFDGGVALNMVIFLSPEPADFAREQLPEMVWMSNLFGRATHNLVLSREVQRAFDAVDDELRSVAAMQQSLLPERLPRSEHFELATHYRTSRRAGGDYYDFFPLSDGRLGILIADVSGHGTPAAVLMAITQTIAQLNDTLHGEPGAFLQRVNETLARRYVQDTGRFVTAFYAIFDPQLRELTYASAGHPSPRVKSIAADRGVRCLAKPTGLPLGIAAEETYATATEPLAPGDRVVFYTDGITEAFNEAGEMFGTERLDAAIAGCQDARCLVESVTAALKGFVGDHAPGDDQTLVVVHVT